MDAPAELIFYLATAFCIHYAWILYYTKLLETNM